MQCPACGSKLSHLDAGCAFCRDLHARYGDRPSFLNALSGFICPLAGFVMYLVMRDDRPLRARSAGRGAAWGLGLTVVLLVLNIPFFVRAVQDARRAACQQNLKQIGMAALYYAENENKGKLPDLSSPASINAALREYTKSLNPFECRTTHQPFQGNPALSFKGPKSLGNPAEVVLFFEAEAAHMDGHNVVYADGHVKRLNERGWREAQAGMEAQARKLRPIVKIAAGGKGVVRAAWNSYQSLISSGDRFAVGFPLFTLHATPNGAAMERGTPYVASWSPVADRHEGAEFRHAATSGPTAESIEVEVQVPAAATPGVKSVEVSSEDEDRNLIGDYYRGAFEVVRRRNDNRN